MEDKINIEQRIDDYLLGRMSKEDRNRFEEDLKTDEDLRKEYDSLKLISRSVSVNHLKSLAAKAEEEYQMTLSADIDRYLQRSMSAEEMASFEQRMESSPAVRQRYEAQKLVGAAVSRNHIRELAAEAEAKYQEKKAPFLKRVFGNIVFQFGSGETEASVSGGTVILRWAAYSFAVAASLAIVAIGGFNFHQHSIAPGIGSDLMGSFNFHQHSIAPGIGSDLMGSLPQTMAAMGPEDDVAALIDTAQAMMGRKEYAYAEISLDEAMSLAREYASDINARDDRDRYTQRIEMLEAYIIDAEWCKAVNYLNDGKARKAKKLLKEIAEEGGTHAEEAKIVLDKLKLFR